MEKFSTEHKEITKQENTEKKDQTQRNEDDPPKLDELHDNTHCDIKELVSLESRLDSLENVKVANYPNGDTYKGQLNSEKKRHGYGLYKMSNGTVYCGQFDNGHPCGIGHYTYASGDQYFGQIAEKDLNGYGKYVSKNGTIHEGYYKDGSRNGYGRMWAPNKSFFSGMYKNDVIEGEGRYRYPSGDVYVGEFRAGKFHGQGTYTFAGNGSQIKGQFADGKPLKK